MSAALVAVPPISSPRPSRRLLRFGQVRLRLGVSRRTLYDWIAGKKFPPHTHELPEIKSLTQRRRWAVEVVDGWTEARRVGSDLAQVRA